MHGARVGVTAGHLLLSEHLGPRQWLGAGLVIASVAALTMLGVIIGVG